jgi:hypothetical protein
MNLSRPIPCPTCGYDLRGLLTMDGAACPECGTTHTAAEINGFTSPTQRRWVVAVALTPFVMLLVWLPAVLVLRHFGDPPAAAIPALAAGLFWPWLCLRRSALLATRQSDSIEDRVLTHVATAAFAGAIAMISGFVAVLLAFAVLFVIHGLGLI